MAETLNRKDIENRIRQILGEELKVNPELLAEIRSETSLFGRGLGLDSMETLTLVSALEREFDIMVPDEDLEVQLFESLGHLVQYIETRVKRRVEP